MFLRRGLSRLGLKRAMLRLASGCLAEAQAVALAPVLLDADVTSGTGADAHANRATA